jgi:hypothetical protein
MAIEKEVCILKKWALRKWRIGVKCSHSHTETAEWLALSFGDPARRPVASESYISILL